MMPFDRIVVSEDDAQKTLAVEEFMEISLHKRMTLILEDRVKFFSGASQLRTVDALRALYAAQNQLATANHA